MEDTTFLRRLMLHLTCVSQNEACVIGTVHKRATLDELSLGQFVIGFVTNVLDTRHVETQHNMLNELVETVKMAENISWPIARGAFAVSLLKIEEESITWIDIRTLVDHRLTYSQSAVFSGSTPMSPTVMLLEYGIRDISRVLVLARNSVYSVEDAIPHVYKMEGHQSFCQNPLILSS